MNSFYTILNTLNTLNTSNTHLIKTRNFQKILQRTTDKENGFIKCFCCEKDRKELEVIEEKKFEYTIQKLNQSLKLPDLVLHKIALYLDRFVLFSEIETWKVNTYSVDEIDRDYEYKIYTLPICSNCFRTVIWNYYLREKKLSVTFSSLFDKVGIHSTSETYNKDNFHTYDKMYESIYFPLRYVCNGYEKEILQETNINGETYFRIPDYSL
jgi:hypothetical protein